MLERARLPTHQGTHPDPQRCTPAEDLYLAQALGDLDLAAQLLTTFPYNGLLLGLSSFELAAGKLPQPKHLGRLAALCGQEHAVTQDCRADNDHLTCSSGSMRGASHTLK